jgi:hypothetical protein
MIQIGWTRGKPSRRGDRPILGNTPNSSGLISGFCFFILLNLLSLFWASVTSPWLAVALGKATSLRTHFWPFTGVLRKIWWFVTRKNGLAMLNRLLSLPAVAGEHLQG